MAWQESSAGIWVVTDSRLTTGSTRLTDNAAKLLEVTATLNECADRDPIWRPVRSTKMGFAYAGSSLVALQAFAAVLPLWSRLYDRRFHFPKVEDFAIHLGRFIATYAKSVGAGTGELPRTECCLFGFDERLGLGEGWLIWPTIRDNDVVCDRRLLRLGDGEIEIFGSGKDVARSRLPTPSTWAREPLGMIRDQLHDDSSEDVGGGVQVGYLNGGGFTLLSDARPEAGASSGFDPRYRGLSFNEIAMVGEATVTLPGIL